LVPTDGQKRIIVHERAYPQFPTHNKLLATPGTLGSVGQTHVHTPNLLRVVLLSLYIIL